MWRKQIGFTPSNTLLKRLINTSIKRAHKKSECVDNLWYSFYIYEKEDEFNKILNYTRPQDHLDPLITFNCNKNTHPFDFKDNNIVHSHIFIESKALFAVLTGISHWNNYEVGSVFQVRRYPDEYKSEMYNYLNFLSVI